MKRLRIILKCLGLVLPALFGMEEVSGQHITNYGQVIYVGHNTNLFVGGNCDHWSSGSKVINDGTIEVKGDWHGNQVLAYQGNNDTFIVSGATDQTISGATYGRFIVNGGGTKRFEGDAAIRDSLVVKSGILTNVFGTASDTLTLLSTAGMKESDTTFFQGVVKTTRNLGIGIVSANTFGGIGAEITILGTTNPGLTSVCRFSGAIVSDLDLYHGTKQRKGIRRYYEIQPTNNGGLAATLVLKYNENELNNINESRMSFFRSSHTGNGLFQWVGQGARDTVNNVNTIAGIDSFSYWVLGGITNPVPVVLTEFAARLASANKVDLNWATSSEQNCSHFEVERSLDGLSWMQVGKEKGNGTTNEMHKYAHQDAVTGLTAPVIYYRLKQVDYNGDFAYSDLRKVKLQGEKAAMRIYPNPAKDRLTIDAPGQNGTYRLTSIGGRLLFAGDFSDRVDVFLYNLKSGAYQVEIRTEDGGRHVEKIFVTGK